MRDRKKEKNEERRKATSEEERERRNLVGPPSFTGERMKEGPRAFQAAAIMHREKCAWGQTGQKNVMALLVLMADLLHAISPCIRPGGTARTTSSFEYVEARIVKIVGDRIRIKRRSRVSCQVYAQHSRQRDGPCIYIRAI